MPTQVPIASPAAFAVTNAVGFADPSNNLVPVSQAEPLAVTVAPAAGAVLAGTASQSAVVGPLALSSGQAAVLSLSGTWSGSVAVLRSTDGGATKLPLTMTGSPWATFDGNACETVWEESASQSDLYLSVVISSGSLSYRLEC